MENSQHKAVLKKLAAVMKDVTSIKKDAKNTFQNYKYASEYAIKTEVGRALRKHGLLFQLSQGVPFEMQSYMDEKGKAHGCIVVPCEYFFWDVDSGESLSGTFNGSGRLGDDKGVYIATTGAIKYIFTSLFTIPTGDDAEGDKQEKRYSERKPYDSTRRLDGPASEAQLKLINTLLKSNKVPKDINNNVMSWYTSGGEKTDKGKQQASEWIECLQAYDKPKRGTTRTKQPESAPPAEYMI